MQDKRRSREKYMESSIIEKSIKLAHQKRRSLPKENSFDITQLQRLPRFFGWVDCDAGLKEKFCMFLAGGDDGVAMRFYWNGFYEKFTLKLWGKASENHNQFVIDVGAHTGAYTLTAFQAGAKHVVSLEPHFGNFSRLLVNLRANNFDTTNALMAGAGREVGVTLLSVPTRLDYLSTGSAIGKKNNCFNFPINVVTIDQIMGEKHQANIGLIKIDVEGHENNVLLGAINSIKKSKPLIFFECLTDEVGNRISETLKPLGYKFWVIDDHAGTIIPTANLKSEYGPDGKINMAKLNRIASTTDINQLFNI